MPKQSIALDIERIRYLTSINNWKYQFIYSDHLRHLTYNIQTQTDN